VLTSCSRRIPKSEGKRAQGARDMNSGGGRETPDAFASVALAAIARVPVSGSFSWRERDYRPEANLGTTACLPQSRRHERGAPARCDGCAVDQGSEKATT
jgi:hypothetical protein